MVLDVLGRAEGERPAEVHGEDAVGEVHDQAHVVLDQDHREVQLGTDVEDEPGHVLGLLDVHAGHRLVEQQQLGLHRQGAAELDALLDAIRQHPDQLLAVALDLEEVDDVLDDAAVVELDPLCPAAVEDARQHPVLEVEVAAQHEVVEDGEVVEQLDVLEHPGDAATGHLVGRAAEQVGAEEPDAPVLRAVDAGDAAATSCRRRWAR